MWSFEEEIANTEEMIACYLASRIHAIHANCKLFTVISQNLSLGAIEAVNPMLELAREG